MSVDCDALGSKLAVPESKLEEIRQHYSTDDLRKEALCKYWLEYMPNASWDTLAGQLFYMGEDSALQAISKYTNKEPGIHNIHTRLFEVSQSLHVVVVVIVVGLCAHAFWPFMV